MDMYQGRFLKLKINTTACQYEGVVGWRDGACWVNFQCRGVLLIWIRVGQGPAALAMGAGGVVWTFLLLSIISYLSPSLWETARYRLKYCLKGSLTPKQPTNNCQYDNCRRHFVYTASTFLVRFRKSFRGHTRDTFTDH